MKMVKFMLFFVIALVSAVILSACFDPTPVDAPPEQAAEVEAEAPDVEDETDAPPADLAPGDRPSIIIWAGAETLDGEPDVFTLVAESFGVAFDVDVERISVPYVDKRNIIGPAIMAGEGPDIFTFTPGAGFVGTLARAGLTYDLTDVAQERGWWDRHVTWTLEQGIFDGRLFAIGTEMEALGIFYNKDIFEEVGATIPQTYDEFLALCELLLNEGVLPLMIDNLDQWPGFHYESLWLNSFVGHEAVAEVLSLEAGWDQPSFGYALDQLYYLVTRGFVNEGINSLSYDDANSLFVAGAAAMRPTGGWMVNWLGHEDQLGDRVGFFFLPPAEGIEMAAPGGIGETWAINAFTAHPEICFDFIDYIFTGDRIRMWIEQHSSIPPVVGVDVLDFDVSPLMREYYLVMTSVDAVGFNIDVLMPARVNDAARGYMQELLAGQITGIEAMRMKQQAFEEEIEAGNFTPLE